MATRKTISLEELTDRVNKMLADSDDDLVEGREALGVLLETVLLEADAYAGFSYLPSEWEKGNLKTDGIDESRRRYYLKADAASGRRRSTPQED